MKKFKIYGIHRHEEICKELERLGVDPLAGIFCCTGDDKCVAVNDNGYWFSMDEGCVLDFSEITLQQLKDTPTPKKWVKKKEAKFIHENRQAVTFDYKDKSGVIQHLAAFQASNFSDIKNLYVTVEYEVEE